MDTIIQSPLATDPNKQQAWTIPDMLFMESGIKEAFLNTMLSRLDGNYSNTAAYILTGCVRTGTVDGSSGSVSVSAGAIFYNGEIYTTTAFIGTLSSNYVVGTVTTTYGTAEVLKDGTSTNVQQIKQIVWSTAASGSGTFNYASALKSVKINATTSLISSPPNLTTSYQTYATFTPSATLNASRLQIMFSGQFASAGFGQAIQVSIFSNSTNIRTFEYNNIVTSGTGDYISLSGFATIPYVAGDVITIQAQVTASNGTMLNLTVDAISV